MNNLISNGNIIDFNINNSADLTIQLKLDENYRSIKQILQKSLESEFPWLQSISIKIPQKEEEMKLNNKPGTLKVNKIIGISSSKGGVGKSTIAINLAISLRNLGNKVGLFDGNIYSPSIPYFIQKESQRLHCPEYDSSQILPIDYQDIKTMSYGYVQQQNNRSVLQQSINGVQANNIIQYLIQKTQWGELDYLIVDMPPGNGDVQSALIKQLEMNGIILVTTPQRISFIDVIKGIEHYQQNKIPTISVVENMSEFVCQNCNTTHKLFGDGNLGILQDQFGIQTSIQIPVFNYISLCSDAGKPVLDTLPKNHTIQKIFKYLANNVINELQVENLDSKYNVTNKFEDDNQLIVIKQGDKVIKQIDSWDLRNSCPCPLCVDEFTGEKLLKEEDIEEDIQAIDIQQLGKYAISIQWSDGHNSIYPYQKLLSDQIPVYQQY